jgi:hypothetical protein
LRLAAGVSDGYLIQIDLDRLRANLSAAERKSLSDQDVREWLEDCGFVARPDGWLCEADQLSQLQHDEIKSARQIA